MTLVRRVKSYSARNIYLKYRKAIWAALGGTTAAGVLAVADMVGLELDPGLASLIAAAVAGLAAKRAKPNVDLPTRKLDPSTSAEPSMEARAEIYADTELEQPPGA